MTPRRGKGFGQLMSELGDAMEAVVFLGGVGIIAWWAIGRYPAAALLIGAVALALVVGGVLWHVRGRAMLEGHQASAVPHSSPTTEPAQNEIGKITEHPVDSQRRKLPHLG